MKRGESAADRGYRWCGLRVRVVFVISSPGFSVSKLFDCSGVLGGLPRTEEFAFREETRENVGCVGTLG